MFIIMFESYTLWRSQVTNPGIIRLSVILLVKLRYLFGLSVIICSCIQDISEGKK